jgi:hypothetical protein
MQNFPATIRTTAIWAAALALTQGARLLEVLPAGRHFARSAFLFDNSDGIALKALDDYWNANPLVPFRTLMDARNQLLERVKHSEREALTEAARGA